MSRTVYGDYVLSSIAPPISGAYALPAEEIKNARPYDPEQAKRLLTEAGHGSGFSTEMIVQRVCINAQIRVPDTATAVQGRINTQFDMAKSARARPFTTSISATWNRIPG